MSQWEYLEVYVDGASWIDSQGRGGRLWFMPGAGALRLQLTAIPLANEFGLEGWELTGVVSPRDRVYRLFFKRPKP